MINFKQYLEEGRDAPLYHTTEIETATSIIKDDLIKPFTTQSFATKRNEKISYKFVKGVSLTRSLNFAKAFRGEYVIIFEFDQSKLVHNHQIVPFNFFAAGAEAHGSDSPARFSKKEDNILNEHEEFLVGPIKNVNKYITKIIVTPSVFSQLSTFKNILNHPKLYVNGKFINK